MLKPIIGVTTYREQSRWGVWDDQADLLPAAYARSIEAAGGITVLLPPTDDPVVDALAVAERIDGLVIAGGADVDPSRYTAVPHERTANWREDRDAWEFALLDAAAATKLPVLGICRGMQVMAVHAGGHLDQHVPDILGHENHSPGGDVYGDVKVTLVDGTQLSKILVTGPSVRCHHHQSVADYPGLVASAHSEDGNLEAIEDPAQPFWLAVQWHPEAQDDVRLFTALVEAAAG
ncbi:MAG: gamma-glutamyl-gamma-aminobutyrate hydrolase family protein [Actinomycetota bacterium]|nr:gamma-glutamyl-gamma-aminobutyrate hydrolase family protein [Actinomycetota bacterium]